MRFMGSLFLANAHENQQRLREVAARERRVRPVSRLLEEVRTRRTIGG